MEQEAEKPQLGQIAGNILLVTAAALLPGIDWALFGWIHVFIPLLVFFYIQKYGPQIGFKYVLSGCALSILGGLITHTFTALLVSFSLIPCGYFLARSAWNKDSPALSGFKGVLALAASWIVLALTAQVITGSSPYSDSLATFDLWIDETVEYYQNNPIEDPRGQEIIQQSLPQMKGILHMVLPGLLFSGALLVILFTMILGNRLVSRFCERESWPLFRVWQLPDKLIWIVIGSAILAFVPSEVTRPIAVNLIILLSTVYSFQGFAICVFFMNKWNVPLLFRSFLYVMLIFQQVGSIILLVLGIFDTWANFRKLVPPDVNGAES